METLTWILGIGSISLGVLSVVLAIVLTHITDKTIKTEDARAKELIEKMEHGIREQLERMDRRSEDTQKMLERMERGTKETIERMDRRSEETQKMLERMDMRTEQLLRHISDLIAAEGEKTRELIKYSGGQV